MVPVWKLEHFLLHPTMDSTRVNLSSQDLNKVLHSFDDDPNNEIRTYTDSPYVTLDYLVSLLSKKNGPIFDSWFKHSEP